jgi:aminopeptidase-like protein
MLAPARSERSIRDLLAALQPQATGARLHDLIGELYPICRSLTGDGVRETLRILQRHCPIEIHEVPTGTTAFDWTVPKEWNIRDAYVKNARGERVIDFRKSNLHVMGYSIPVRARMGLAELKTRVYSLPDKPDVVPLRTGYFREDWGLSMAHSEVLKLEEGEYEVCIDSSLEPGHLTYGECLSPGETSEEVLISTHVCHPSLANDNLSGVAMGALLAGALAECRSRYSYRFLFIPAQVGSIVWLSRNERTLDRVRHGLVLVAMGDSGNPTYKRSRRGNAAIDRAAEHVLKHAGVSCRVMDFFPHGNDERQFCSPGFDLPVGSLMRTPCGTFPQYHTSDDNLEFVTPEALADSFAKCLEIFQVLEGDRRFLNLNPKCEPQLGRRGLYRTTGDVSGGGKVKEMPILWVLNQSDGEHSLLDIAERSGIPFRDILAASESLAACGLLRALP